jgi:hypothetical protein
MRKFTKFFKDDFMHLRHFFRLFLISKSTSPAPPQGNLLLEDGFDFLLEDSDFILLED